MALGNILRGIGHQINPFDAGRTYDTNAAGRNPGYRQATPAPAAPPFVIRSGQSAFNEWRNPAQDALNRDLLAAQNASTAAMNAQIAAMPKLPSFDILGNYNRAKTQAEATQRPRYDQMWQNFINEQGIKKTAAQSQAALGKERIGSEQRQTKEDISTNRTRTAEDVATALERIGLGEAMFQSDEGREFDVARRGLQEQVAGSGLTTSGLGQAAIDEQVNRRNEVSERQTQEFEVQRQAKELFKNRTFADLERGELRADEKALLSNKGIDLDLDTQLKELAAEEQTKRFDWEADLLSAIGTETSRLNKEGVAQFINSLVGSGARAQDIALAKEIYG